MHVGPQEGDVGRAREGRLPGEALVDHTAERVDVRTLVHRVARDLLRRDVLEGADDLPGDRDSGQRAGSLREAEVAEVAMLATGGCGDEDVGRLDVPMDESLLVSGVEGLRDLREEVDGPLRLECPVLGDDLREIGAFDVAHREEENAVLLSGLVDGDDVRMVERGRDPRLAQEALAEALVLGELGRDHLERDLAPEPCLLGTVDRTHPPAADERFDPVAGDRRSRRQRGARDVAHRPLVTVAASSVYARCVARSFAEQTLRDEGREDVTSAGRGRRGL